MLLFARVTIVDLEQVSVSWAVSGFPIFLELSQDHDDEMIQIQQAKIIEMKRLLILV